MPDSDSSLILSVSKDVRTELRDFRGMALAHSDAFRRIEWRFDAIDRRFDAVDARFRDLRDDLELMIKSEMIGRAAQFEAAYDEKLAKLEDRIAKLKEGRPHS